MARFFTDRGVIVEPSAPNTQAQNGGAERSRGVIKLKARAMKIAARFPHYLWVEIYKDDLCKVTLPQMLQILEAREVQEKEDDTLTATQPHYNFQTQEEGEAEEEEELVLD